MSRVEAASGAKYSAHREAPRKFEPIAPVGANYIPVGKPDIGSLRQGSNPPPPPSQPASSRPVATALRPVPPAPSPAAGFGKTPLANRAAAPDDAWGAPSAPTQPPPPPAAARPPVTMVSRPSPAVGAQL